MRGCQDLHGRKIYFSGDFCPAVCRVIFSFAFSNTFALYTATARAAEMAGIGAKTGTIEPGKCADFIVTAKNPLENLRALRQIEMVVAKGRKIDHPQVKRNPVVTAELDKFLVD